MKEVQVAVERAGLGERGLQGGVLGAAEVHAVAQPQHRPVASRALPRARLTRGPQLLPRLGSFCVSGSSGLASAAMGGGNCSRSQRSPAENDQQLAGLPLRGGKSGPVVGAQMPVGGTHGLRVVGVAGQAAQPMQRARRVAPHLARLVAVVLVVRVQLRRRGQSSAKTSASETKFSTLE